MSEESYAPLPRCNERTALTVVTSAFVNDPVERWLYQDMYAALDQMGRAHPNARHWYLAWLAAEPGAQGRGLGADLLTRCLAVVDAQHQPAYLETPNPRTVRFYARHGFARVGETRAGSCPPITFMHRSAR